MNVKNKSPLRYVGGKTRACKIIERELIDYLNTKNIDISSFRVLISPFLGGGSFEFYFQNKYKIPIRANDKFLPLANFWKMVKTKKTELTDKIRSLKPVTKDQFIQYRDQILTIQDSVTQAAYYFVINRSSFSGATLSGGFSKEAANKRFTDSSIERVRNLNLEYFEISNLDFSEFLENQSSQQPQQPQQQQPSPQDRNLIFLDPPYYLEKKSKLYGKNGDMHENFNHNQLAQILKNMNNWILCYNDCEYIRNVYKDFDIKDVNWSYGMNKTKKSSEILILNFQ